MERNMNIPSLQVPMATLMATLVATLERGGQMPKMKLDSKDE
jgi:hypothetical protein